MVGVVGVMIGYEGAPRATLVVMSEPAIHLQNVGVLRGETWLIRNVSWHVQRNTTVAVLGPNGCGKSTLLRVIGGQLYPTRGQVTVAGVRFGQGDLRAMRRRVRLVTPPGTAENPHLPPGELPVELVVCGALDGTARFDRAATPDELAAAEAALQAAGADRLWGRTFGTLSTGERTRVQLARALITRPEVLLLDEPGHGLDLSGREALLRTLADLHGTLTMVVVTHHPEELPPTTSQALLMRAGGELVASGAADETLTSSLLSRTFDLPLHAHREAGRTWVRVERG